MTDLTAQYRARNGVTRFEVFAERDGLLYGRVFNSDIGGYWQPWGWTSDGITTHSPFNIERTPATPEQKPTNNIPERHAKFAAYWEAIGKPPLEFQTDKKWLNVVGKPLWADCDYRIKGDIHWRLRKEWVDSGFELPIEFEMSPNKWVLIINDRWRNVGWCESYNYRKAEPKPATPPDDMKPDPADHGLKVDDLVWVWNDDKQHLKKLMYFSNFSEDGLVVVFGFGSTSFTANGNKVYCDNWEKYEPAQSLHEDAKPEPTQWPEPHNEEMTRMAEENGLSHWRCVSSKSSEWWQRIDGTEVHIQLVSSDMQDALRTYDKMYPMTPNPQAEPKWHEYLKHGYKVVCEVWDKSDNAPLSVDVIIGIEFDGQYVGSHEWDCARPVPTECGKFCTGIKDSKTVLLPLE